MERSIDILRKLKDICTNITCCECKEQNKKIYEFCNAKLSRTPCEWDLDEIKEVIEEIEHTEVNLRRTQN